jgi:hypothetical protein
MAEQSKSQTQAKQEGPEPQQLTGPQEAAATPEAGLVATALAAGGPESHAQLLADTRIPAVQRQKAAVRLSRTRGNRYVQGLVDRRSGVIQRDEETAEGGEEEGESLTEKIRQATEGAGTDERAIYLALRSASPAQRRAVLGGEVMGMLRGDLSGEELLKAARLLAVGLSTRERRQVAKALLDLSAAPAGKIRDATGLLLLSSRIVDRNTAQRILDGDVEIHYLEDLTQPPNVENLVRGYGRDPADFTLYYQPGSTTQTVWVQTNAQGFRIVGTNIIVGQRALMLDRWVTLLVHETNHARNPDPTTPLENYQGEFRAYWVAEFRTVANLDERARQIKAHVLRDYPEIRAAYDADARVRRAIDAHTRPDGNILNV